MKTPAVIILILISCLLLFSCGTENAEAPIPEATAAVDTSAPESDAIKVGVSLYGDLMASLQSGIESGFEAHESDGVEYELDISEVSDGAAEQLAQVEEFISRGVDVIVLALSRPDTAEEIVSMTAEAGIGLVLISSEPECGHGDTAACIRYDARCAGTMQGELVAELDDHGDINGDGRISYLLIEGDTDDAEASVRSEYAVKALEDSGYEPEELDRQSGDWEHSRGRDICADALERFGSRLEVVLCGNDAMAVGAAAAIREAGRSVGKDIYLLGIDGTLEGAELTADGEMTGTVLIDRRELCGAAVDAAVRLINGEAAEDCTIDCYKVI